MVWAGVTMNRRTRLCIVDGNINAQRYVDKILQPVVVLSLGRMNQGAILQDEKADPTVDALFMNLADCSTSGDLISRPTHLISTQLSISGMSWEEGSIDITFHRLKFSYIKASYTSGTTSHTKQSEDVFRACVGIVKLV